MGKKSSPAKLYFFFLTLFLVSILYGSRVMTYAKDRNVLIFRSGGTIQKTVDAGALFTEPVFPGSSEQSCLNIFSSLSKPLSCSLRIEAEEKTELLEKLHMRIYTKDGKTLYEGALCSAEVKDQTIESRKKYSFCFDLSLPEDAPQSIAGKSGEFRLILEMSSDENPTEKTASDSAGSSGKSSGSGTGGSGGTGLKAYEFAGSGSAENRIIGSPYVRTGFLNDNGGLKPGMENLRRGFFGNADSIGGGAEQMHERPVLSLKTGTDSGHWVQNKQGFWQYVFSNGEFARDGFLLAENPYANRSYSYGWFYFDPEGRMQSGWIRLSGNSWYHAHEEADGDQGALEAGWLDEAQDGRSYYLHERTAEMVSGWIGFSDTLLSETEYYYFAALSDTVRQNWFYRTAIGRWLYDRLGCRSYGSLYRNEVTPDGYTADSFGRCPEKGAAV